MSKPDSGNVGWASTPGEGLQARPKIQFKVLYRQFLFRMVDLEVLSAQAQGDISKLLGQFAALLVFLSILFTFPALGVGALTKQPLQIAWIGTLSLEHFLIATTMLVVGLFAVLSWDSTFPDRRDVMVLAPLPVRARTIFLAKIAAVATALSLTVLILHIAAGLIWPLMLNSINNTGIVPAFTSDPPAPPVPASQLEPIVKRDIGNALTPGAGIAIGVWQHGDRRIFTLGAAKPDSLFEVGSITKTFTGLLLAKMVSEGKAAYNQPVRELLPEGTVKKPRTTEITLLDLATQHSGLPRMPGNFHPADQANPYADYHVEDLYNYMRGHGVAKPSWATFGYSNLGVGLLGQALSERAGVPYPQLIEREITGPLGMHDTAISLTPDQQKRFIQGHNFDHNPVHSWELDALAGAGAIRSTAGDMLTYLVANLHPDRSPFPGALNQSHELRSDIGPGARIAIVWFYDIERGNYNHGGATAGFTGDATFNQKDDFALIVLSNTGPSTVISADMIADHIRSRMLGKAPVSISSVNLPSGGGFLGLLRMFATYWVTMLASGAFIYCLVLGVQGLSAQLLPRRLFLRVSSWLQLASFCFFVCGYFFQPTFTYPQALLEAQRTGWLAWSPSYWFLGFFQQLSGSPALALLAKKAWLGLAVVGTATATAYVLSYVRTLRKIVEEPDIVPGVGATNWLPSFGSAFESALGQFTVRTLLRSRQHRIILAFYLGIGFAITIFLVRAPEARQMGGDTASDPWRQVSVTLLSSSIMLLGFWIMGMRVVFSLPLDLRANWVFRITPVPGGLKCLKARRRAMFALALAPVWTAWAILFLSLWPWRQAVGHLLVLGLMGAALAELCLHGVQKIPFTCSYLPGKSNLHIMFWVCINAVMVVITKWAEFEKVALIDPAKYSTVLVGLLAVILLARWKTTALANSEETNLQFEDSLPPVVQGLGLYRDGVLPT